MARKPETTFRDSVHRHLPKSLHREKTNNPYSSGTADDWYSGRVGDLWVEYKFLPKVPLRAVVKPFELLSAQQLDWIEGRYKDFATSGERAVAVIIGCPKGGVILSDQEWNRQFTAEEFRDRLVPRQAIAQWIASKTTR